MLEPVMVILVSDVVAGRKDKKHEIHASDKPAVHADATREAEGESAHAVMTLGSTDQSLAL